MHYVSTSALIRLLIETAFKNKKRIQEFPGFPLPLPKCSPFDSLYAVLLFPSKCQLAMIFMALVHRQGTVRGRGYLNREVPL